MRQGQIIGRMCVLMLAVALHAATAGSARADVGAPAGLGAACTGDCGGDGMVSIADLIVGVNIALGSADTDTCAAFDADGDGSVVVSELVQAVNHALSGCPAAAGPCEAAADAALLTCVDAVNAAQRRCYDDGGAACAPNDAQIATALDTLASTIAAGCPDTASVRAAGYGAAATPEGLARRLAAACQAEPAALAARTFGGPQGAALAAGTAAAVACLEATHDDAAAFMRDAAARYGACTTNPACDAAAVEAQVAALQDDLAGAAANACGALQERIAVDATTYAARAAAQVRCLTATAHPDSAPLALDCGPRDGIAAAPRGEYVQVVLDEAVWGTRCGDGSPYAFWVRLAPAGQPVENVVVGLEGGGVCIFGADCATRDPDLFEARSDLPETGGPLSNDPAVSPFADWTKVYLPYCNQDVFIGGGATSSFDEVTVHRFGAVNVRASLRYVRDLLWGELAATAADGYRPDALRVLFGGFSAGAFGTIYNYHYLLDDLQWAHTAAYPDAGLALDNGEALGVATLGALLISDVPPLGWGAGDYLPPYCFATNCGVGPLLLAATAPRLLAVPEQQILVLSNQVDDTQVATTFFSSVVPWINALRTSYCATRTLPGVQYFLPAITDSVHVISPREELYTNYPVDGVLMRDWLADAFANPASVTDQVEEGTLVADYPGVLPFACIE